MSKLWMAVRVAKLARAVDGDLMRMGAQWAGQRIRESVLEARNKRAASWLARVGLERRRSLLMRVAPVLGGFGVGIVVGGAAVALLSPVPAPELRQRLSERAGTLARRTGDSGRGVPEPTPEA